MKLDLRFLLCLFIAALTYSRPAIADSQTDIQQEVAELRRIVAEQQKVIADLRERLDALERRKAAAPEEPEIPRAEVAPETAPTVARPPVSTFMPDFAVIGNHRGVFLVPKGYEGRNRFQLGELEIALQQPIYTGMNFYATLAGGADAGFTMGVEEAYVTLSRPFKLPFDGTVGKRRLQFGKVNALHPHQWRYVDAPAAVAAFLGHEGFFGNGASVNYTLPVRGLFANLEVGFWGPASAHAHANETSNGETHAHVTRGRNGDDDDEDHEHEEDHEDDHDHEHHHHEAGPGIVTEMPVARLWLSRAIGNAGELELGLSHAWGKAEGGDPIRLGGLDFTYRHFPSTFSRLQLQGELFWHRRKERAENLWHTRSGHYLFLSYAPDKYYEYGLRFDNTRFPWPIEGREQSLSLILTNRLSEATLVRLQYKFGDRTSDLLGPARRGFSEVFLQFIWGAGSHKHPLQ